MGNYKKEISEISDTNPLIFLLALIFAPYNPLTRLRYISNSCIDVDIRSLNTNANIPIAYHCIQYLYW